MTHQAILTPAADTKILWKESLARMELGDKLLVHGRTQASVGGALADFNRNGKRFVSKKGKNGVYVIRVL